MMGRPSNIPEPSAAELAGRWFARRRSGAMTAAEAQELDAWLRRDPGHRAALEQVERAWENIEDARAAPEIMALRERARGRRAGISRAVIGRAMAACLAIGVLAGAGLGLREAGVFASDAYQDQRFATAIGEKRSITLADGSVVTLNTDTVLRTVEARHERLVYLDHGQAFFRVASDPDRPFIVHAGGRQVTAVGTAFDVRVDGQRFEVTLVEGKVRVQTPVTASPTMAEGGLTTAAAAPALRTTEMLPGDRLVASLDNQVVSHAEAADRVDWIVGRLTFEGEPMGDVAAEFGRYTTRKLIIEDPDLAQRPVSGTFDARDAQAFAEALQIAGLARIESATPQAIRLAPPAS